MKLVQAPGQPDQKSGKILIAATRLLLAISLALFIWLPEASAADKRQKVIDFEDELVEGVNRRPLDSLNTLSDAEKRRRKTHLYRKRRGFRIETDETLKVLRYTP
ncbi:MAG: hypothetical protein A2X94_00105 [Bdellovibrionales bacterium GWB1_55_8]|nr:MAG: hypothetical protein A2X94_00105 [Bdellovibrionales bacterium GWB1_55_8]